MERMRGIVIAVRPRRVLVRAQGREYSCPVLKRMTRGERTARAPLAVGDRVSIEISSGGSSTLMEVEPRRTQIPRLAGIPPREQVIAANVDRVLALQAVDQPPFDAAALDRLLVIAEAGGVLAAIGLNKTDLATAGSAENRSGPGHAEQLLISYRQSRYPVFLLSARLARGIEALEESLSGHETVILGPSGVGKSTLLNRLIPGLSQRTQAVRRVSGHGVHTTTRVDYLDLPGGGAVLDTPGIGITVPAGVKPRDLARLYPEFSIHLGACRFADCLHSGEPGCTLEEAARAGEVSCERWERYRELLRSLIGQTTGIGRN